VWQRNFDWLFGLQRYQKATGNNSLYDHSPKHGLNFLLRDRQYLAGNGGAAF